MGLGEDLGAKMLRRAAVKTSETAGDGTTTATLLAHAMINVGLIRIADKNQTLRLPKSWAVHDQKETFESC